VKKSETFALITGAAGGIGQALVRSFDQAGYTIIATDLLTPPDNLPCKYFIKADLQRTVNEEAYAQDVFATIRKHLNGNPLKVLINNAATQITGKVENLTHNDWQATLNVNLMAPFFWTQELLPELESTQGSVINISSIHARLTKRGFTAYATSKAALSSLTRSLALELGDRIRVNAIEPAAIDTEMLRDGFRKNTEGLMNLKQYHPTQSIGRPQEIGRLSLMLTDEKMPFLNGATIRLDGGISGCLHDPG
jgi:NAD(P)-dependent dehydrogenase (short-subunit alcohol dehydrogenase family)